jgi:hypothetical protein
MTESLCDDESNGERIGLEAISARIGAIRSQIFCFMIWYWETYLDRYLRISSLWQRFQILSRTLNRTVVLDIVRPRVYLYLSSSLFLALLCDNNLP